MRPTTRGGTHTSTGSSGGNSVQTDEEPLMVHIPAWIVTLNRIRGGVSLPMSIGQGIHGVLYVADEFGYIHPA